MATKYFKCCHIIEGILQKKDTPKQCKTISKVYLKPVPSCTSETCGPYKENKSKTQAMSMNFFKNTERNTRRNKIGN
jgi:hypothetical protein